MRMHQRLGAVLGQNGPTNRRRECAFERPAAGIGVGTSGRRPPPRRRGGVGAGLPRARTARSRRADGGLARARHRARRPGPREASPTGANVPAQLAIPPEVAHEYTGIRLTWKDQSDGKSGTIEVPLGGETPLPDPSLVVKTDAFLPAFTMGAGSITSEGVEPTNPAARIAVFEKGQQIFGGWIFTKFPDVHPFTHKRFELRLEGGIRKTGEAGRLSANAQNRTVRPRSPRSSSSAARVALEVLERQQHRERPRQIEDPRERVALGPRPGLDDDAPGVGEAEKRDRGRVLGRQVDARPDRVAEGDVDRVVVAAVRPPILVVRDGEVEAAPEDVRGEEAGRDPLDRLVVLVALLFGVAAEDAQGRQDRIGHAAADRLEEESLEGAGVDGAAVDLVLRQSVRASIERP